MAFSFLKNEKKYCHCHYHRCHRYHHHVHHQHLHSQWHSHRHNKHTPEISCLGWRPVRTLAKFILRLFLLFWRAIHAFGKCFFFPRVWSYKCFNLKKRQTVADSYCFHILLHHRPRFSRLTFDDFPVCWKVTRLFKKGNIFLISQSWKFWPQKHDKSFVKMILPVSVQLVPTLQVSGKARRVLSPKKTCWAKLKIDC